MNEEIADLQAQVVALRVAMEGVWLSLLAQDRDPAGAARRLGERNLATIGELEAKNAGAEAARAAVMHHTEQLWGSIAWQLDGATKQDEA